MQRKCVTENIFFALGISSLRMLALSIQLVIFHSYQKANALYNLDFFFLISST